MVEGWEWIIKYKYGEKFHFFSELEEKLHYWYYPANNYMTDQMKATVVPTFDKKDIEENKVLACLSYVGILFLIPLLAKKDSKFCQEHAKQGLVFFITGLALMVISMVPVLGWIVGFFGWIVMLVVGLMAIIKTLQGEFWVIPVVGQYRSKINL